MPEEVGREIRCFDDGCELDPANQSVYLDTDKVVIGGGYIRIEDSEQAIPLKGNKITKQKRKPSKTTKVGAGSKKKTKSKPASKPKAAKKKPAAKKPKTKKSKKSAKK